jgi:methylmalonyl-CoA mutase
VAEIVECAIEEDVHGIAITSYQGGHVEFFKYMKDLLNQNGCGHIRIFGGGGGTILPDEIAELHQYGIARIYSPDDGRKLGLEGMIEDLLKQCDFTLNGSGEYHEPMQLGEVKDVRSIARKITNAENGLRLITNPIAQTKKIPVLGITGTGGAGKSSVTDELVRRFLNHTIDKTIAVISVDPSKKKTGGALLGDRIRMNAIHHPRAYMRSLATRESDRALSEYVQDAINICKDESFDLIILESAGVGQSDASILDYCDVSLYVMTPEYGAASQLEKINMLDFADCIAINKFDKAGALDALHDVRKQYKRNHGLWTAKDNELPIIGTIASQFNDPGVNNLFISLVDRIVAKTHVDLELQPMTKVDELSSKSIIIPPSRVRYLSEITDIIRSYNKEAVQQADIASSIYKLQGAVELVDDEGAKKALTSKLNVLYEQLSPVNRKLLENWPAKLRAYQENEFEYNVRDKIIRQPMFSLTLSGIRIPKVIMPKFRDWGDILKWEAQENTPGQFPFTAGVFPLKREGEDPTWMFAGEGIPERSNRRFHYVALDQPA